MFVKDCQRSFDKSNANVFFEVQRCSHVAFLLVHRPRLLEGPLQTDGDRKS